jgi:carbon monoxide dehydrogenase subunit G
MSLVQQAIEVSAPLHTVYEQLAAFENYPRFMSGVAQVTPIGNQQTHWVMDLDGKRREFDAKITELSFDERVSWATVDGPLLAETITVRPMGETRTQVIAQLEADIAFLMPSDRHGQETLNRRLKHDLNTFKSLVESGRMASPALSEADSRQMSGQSTTIFGGAPQLDPASPASVAARIRNRPVVSWDAEDNAIMASDVAGDGADRDDVAAPDQRLARQMRGGAAAGVAGSAPMGGRTPKNDGWGDGMINEEDRGSARDF